MSQNASDYIPACLPKESARTRVGKALAFMSHRCDHAHQRDGHGFNKFDSPYRQPEQKIPWAQPDQYRCKSSKKEAGHSLQ